MRDALLFDVLKADYETVVRERDEARRDLAAMREQRREWHKAAIDLRCKVDLMASRLLDGTWTYGIELMQERNELRRALDEAKVVLAEFVRLAVKHRHSEWCSSRRGACTVCNFMPWGGPHYSGTFNYHKFVPPQCDCAVSLTEIEAFGCDREANGQAVCSAWCGSSLCAASWKSRLPRAGGNNVESK